MAVTLNLKGTSLDSFKVGKSASGSLAAGSLDLNVSSDPPKLIGRIRFDATNQQLVFCLPDNNEVVLGRTTNSKYVHQFNDTTDWGDAVGGFYSINILATAHKMGEFPIVQIHEASGLGFDVVHVSDVKITTVGDVTIRVPAAPNGRFIGRVVIG